MGICNEAPWCQTGSVPYGLDVLFVVNENRVFPIKEIYIISNRCGGIKTALSSSHIAIQAGARIR